MHDLDFDHGHVSAEEQQAIAEVIWNADNVELTTVGIDVGSSTSHLMFARVHLQRLTTALSSRFVVVGREVLWRSPILLTPYLPDNTIDVGQLAKFFDAAFKEANLTRDQIDSGAVILTGEALKRNNAEAITHLFAAESGKFVCASAGHHMECAMAAHGSGAVALSRKEKTTVMNIDIGGGTTKFALVDKGQLVATAAVEVGGRLVAFDDKSKLVRVEGPALRHAKKAGVEVALGKTLSDTDKKKIVDTMVGVMLEVLAQGTPKGLTDELMVTEPLPHAPKPELITFSGGVAEYIFERVAGDRQDLGRMLGQAIVQAIKDKRINARVVDPGQGIRATVIGASQFSVQVSGNTISISNEGALPMRNVPVLYPHVDLSDEIDAELIAGEIKKAHTRFDFTEGEQPVALAFRWKGDPLHSRLKALADGIHLGLHNTVHEKKPLVLVLDGDIARTLGEILRKECDVAGDIVSVDGVQLREFDYVDIGEMIRPTNVVPLVIKSLLFSAPGMAH
ncbi:MAG TPA: ethanolamine ammonia-lyase reactivating factor EutA [Alphaproteobacteria bacterium]|nr:ethanolamine ammonia-lyase reactivating factor EutA [Alphaproteobacteria bacterium]